MNGVIVGPVICLQTEARMEDASPPDRGGGALRSCETCALPEGLDQGIPD